MKHDSLTGFALGVGVTAVALILIQAYPPAILHLVLTQIEHRLRTPYAFGT